MFTVNTGYWGLFHAKFGGPCKQLEFENTRPDNHQTQTTSAYNTSVLNGWVDELDGPVYAEAVRIFQADLEKFGVSHESCEACYREAGLDLEWSWLVRMTKSWRQRLKPLRLSSAGQEELRKPQHIWAYCMTHIFHSGSYSMISWDITYHNVSYTHYNPTIIYHDIPYMSYILWFVILYHFWFKYTYIYHNISYIKSYYILAYTLIHIYIEILLHHTMHTIHAISHHISYIASSVSHYVMTYHNISLFWTMGLVSGDATSL